MASSSSSCYICSLPLALVCLLLFQPLTSLSLTATSVRLRTSAKPLLLPLGAQKVQALPPRPGNKLRFHHNVSLTVSLAVGTPPQNVSMVLDTGSELSWLVCNSSSSAAAFSPRSSSSFHPIPCSSPTCLNRTRDLPSPGYCDPASRLCRVSLSYADASTADGALAGDSFVLGGQRPPAPTVFGCMSSSFSSSAGDVPAAAGLLGMNRGALSFVTQAGIRRFSYCISGDDASGVLLLGDAEPPFLLPLNYTPLIQISLPLPYFDRVAYSVQLEGIRVAGVLLPIPKSVLAPDHTGAGQTMVDSGTQFTFLLGEAYNALKMEFLRQTEGALRPLNEPDFVFEGAFDLCFRNPPGFRPSKGLPSVALVLQGAEVAVAGWDRLLYRVEGETRAGDEVWCFTFGNSDLVPMWAYVIGHHHQQNVWVGYDLENSRVGFAPVRCNQASRRLGATS